MVKGSEAKCVVVNLFLDRESMLWTDYQNYFLCICMRFLITVAVMIRKFLRSPSEIQKVFEFAWSYSVRSSCVVLYIPRFGKGVNLIEPVWSRFCFQHRLVIVWTLSGEELGIILGRSSICMSLWFQNNGWGICGSGMRDFGTRCDQDDSAEQVDI